MEWGAGTPVEFHFSMIPCLRVWMKIHLNVWYEGSAPFPPEVSGSRMSVEKLCLRCIAERLYVLEVK